MLTIDERSIIKLYYDKHPDRMSVIAALKNALPHVEEEETKKAVTSALRKLTAMSDKTFNSLDLSETLVAEQISK